MRSNGGADIIDLKNPTKGAFGALDPVAARAAVAAIAGRRPTSAVIGDLPVEPDVVAAAAETMSRTGVNYVKIGLFSGPLSSRTASARYRRWRRAPGSLA